MSAIHSHSHNHPSVPQDPIFTLICSQPCEGVDWDIILTEMNETCPTATDSAIRCRHIKSEVVIDTHYDANNFRYMMATLWLSKRQIWGENGSTQKYIATITKILGDAEFIKVEKEFSTKAKMRDYVRKLTGQKCAKLYVITRFKTERTTLTTVDLQPSVTLCLSRTTFKNNDKYDHCSIDHDPLKAKVLETICSKLKLQKALHPYLHYLQTHQNRAYRMLQRR
jgi:hypothetical protein